MNKLKLMVAILIFLVSNIYALNWVQAHHPARIDVTWFPPNGGIYVFFIGIYGYIAFLLLFFMGDWLLNKTNITSVWSRVTLSFILLVAVGAKGGISIVEECGAIIQWIKNGTVPAYFWRNGFQFLIPAFHALLFSFLYAKYLKQWSVKE